ncbi:MAG: ABC transporter ATP-binding protein [Clostridiales bacterium]|nr:ABC transporter ATP-binding protein [Candidatus Apopatocola equi]MCQ2439114.1 ABC transporter ATP-binding protein [Oscillospiraceae bacterium]
MLKIEHLTKHYPGSDKGVTDLCLHVESGSICAFIGPNGAGKTTTLKCIVGLHDFEEGAVTVCGHDVKREPLACKRSLAYLPDDPELFDYLTGSQYLSFVADVFGVSDAERKTRIGELAGRFELTEELPQLISGYSHGMKQKLALISAFLHDPQLLILDEPFVGLDPSAAITVRELMNDLRKRGGAVLFSTHVLEVAEKLCSHVAILKDGRLVRSGPMESVLRPGVTLEDIFLEVAERG